MNIWMRYAPRVAAMAAIAGAAAMSVPTAQAQVFKQPNGYTWGELSLLPDYCKDVQGVLWGDHTNPSPRAAHWVSLMGEGFWAMHHYCRALTMVRRASEPGLTRNRKGFFLEKAKDDYRYTVENVPADMPLLPEVWLRYGEVFLIQDDLVSAKEAFDRARQIKPDYWPAYTRWIDIQLGLKQFAQARALAQEGLKYSPDNPELKQRLAALERRGSADGAGTSRVAAGKAPAEAASGAGATPR